MKETEVKVTRVPGGTAMRRGQEVACREKVYFDAGKQGTAVISIIVEPCDEEQRKKNRERVDAAVWLMYQNVMQKRAREAAASGE